MVFGAPQRLSTVSRTKIPWCTRSPGPSDSAVRDSNGMKGSTKPESAVLVPSPSVTLLRKRSVRPRSSSVTV